MARGESTSRGNAEYYLWDVTSCSLEYVFLSFERTTVFIFRVGYNTYVIADHGEKVAHSCFYGRPVINPRGKALLVVP
jgi:hypothetical protein